MIRNAKNFFWTLATALVPHIVNAIARKLKPPPDAPAAADPAPYWEDAFDMVDAEVVAYAPPR